MSIIASLIGPVSSILDKVVPDADEKARLAHEIATMSDQHAQQLALAQVEVNKAEASHRSIFVAGWRPCIGWISASALGFNFILAPCLEWYIAFAKLDIVLPTISLNELYPIILGMLGLGFARSYEKKNQLTK